MGAGKHITEVDSKKIVEAIRQAEKLTSGEIRVHLCKSRETVDPMAPAREAFMRLNMHQTKDRNGILLYVNLRQHTFAFFGDEGIHQKVGQPFWDHLRDTTVTAIREKSLTDALVLAVLELGNTLGHYFPRAGNDQNELSNEISHGTQD